MATDLELIKELEKEIGTSLEQREFLEIPLNGKNGFSIDENGNVIGLNFDYIKLGKMPFRISKFHHLKKINLIDTGLNDISILKDLRDLEHLDLSSNQIGYISIPKELNNLKALDLRKNQISDISMLEGLWDLETLILAGNQINDISLLKDFTNLKVLILASNQISNITVLKELENLTLLYLSHNKIINIPVLADLKGLTRLDLRDNKIRVLPEEILELEMEIKWKWETGSGIFLEKNPFEQPPIEIVKKGKETIRSYFKSLAGEKQALNEVKVLLVGDGGAGKTSLVKRLLEEGFNKNEPQTHGINIKSWKIEEDSKEIKVNFWDFGGQEIMHATHQFFLSKRSLYILVLDCRKDEKTEYWLKHIKSFGSDSPVLVVLNKIDENPNFDVNRPFLQDKYKNIKGFYRVSCAENTGIKEFSQDLKIALENVELIQTTWAKTWFNVKTQLESITEHYINYEQYKNICETEKILDSKSQETLVEFLNDLGIVLHFKEFELEDTHVLEPKWVTEAVYKIINSKELAESKGILNLRLLDRILKKKKKEDYYYPRDKYRYIITLMKKFELCYGIDEETVLIPDLLTVQEPPFDFDYSSSLKFIIEYDFLPRSVMPRFIVKMHKDIKKNLRWRTGVVLEDKAFQTTALIKADHDDKKIYIYVHGQQKRDYFSVIRYAFSSINHSFEKIGAKEMVPCTCQECDNIKNPHFYNYATLAKFRQKGRKNIPCSLSAEDVAIDKLLDGIERTEADKEEEILQILRKLKEDSDNRETLLKKANEVITLQPNIMGVGINLNNLIKKLLPGKK